MIAERIRAARAEAGLTIAELAAKVGVDPRTVAGWQATPPRSLPSWERLDALAQALGKPVSYFVGEAAA